MTGQLDTSTAVIARMLMSFARRSCCQWWLQGVASKRDNRRDEMLTSDGVEMLEDRVLHEAVGGFDESLPYLHDTDYCWRIQLAGTELHFVPEAVVHIRTRHTLPGIFRQARNWAEYNVLMYKRYLRYAPAPPEAGPSRVAASRTKSSACAGQIRLEQVGVGTRLEDRAIAG